MAESPNPTSKPSIAAMLADIATRGQADAAFATLMTDMIVEVHEHPEIKTDAVIISLHRIVPNEENPGEPHSMASTITAGTGVILHGLLAEVAYKVNERRRKHDEARMMRGVLEDLAQGLLRPEKPAAEEPSRPEEMPAPQNEMIPVEDGDSPEAEAPVVCRTDDGPAITGPSIE